MNATEKRPPLLDKALWLSWERHRRSCSLSARLGIPLFEFQSNAPRWIRHPGFVLRTIALLVRKRPRLLFVQNPSAFLTLLAIILKPLFRYHLIVDAHNAGVYPFQTEHEKFAAVFPFMHRHADLTIVTNFVLADIVKKNGGRPIVLPDPLPDFSAMLPTRAKKENGLFVVTMICSFANDEPYVEVFKAAKLLPDYIRIYVTGDASKLSKSEMDLVCKNNIILTGFLPDDEYLQHLCNSDCVMVLTNFDDCMVCGAYEAISLSVPLILSKSTAMHEWFENFVIFVKCNNAKEIHSSILYIVKNYNDICSNCKKVGPYIEKKWNVQFLELLNFISSYDAS